MSQEQKDIAPGTQTNPDSAPLHPGYVTETDGTAQAGETPDSAPLHPGYVYLGHHESKPPNASFPRRRESITHVPFETMRGF